MSDLVVVHYPFKYRQETLHRPIRLAIWNVWFRASASRIIEALRHLDCDVLMLMELTRYSRQNPNFNLPAVICEDLGYGSVFAECRRFGGGKRVCSEGIGIFSRLPITSPSISKLSSGGRAPFKGGQLARRCIVEARLEIPGADALDLGLAHLSYRLPLDLGGSQRQGELDNLLACIALHKQNFLLGGDFNAKPDSPTVAAISKHLRHLGPDLAIPSWGSVPRAGRIFGRRRLDYAFGTADIQVVSAQLRPKEPSDHNPLVLEVSTGL